MRKTEKIQRLTPTRILLIIRRRYLLSVSASDSQSTNNVTAQTRPSSFQDVSNLHPYCVRCADVLAVK